MTIALAFDCCCAQIAAAVALAEAPGEVRVLSRRARSLDRGHAAALMEVLQQVLREADVAVQQIDLLAVTIGPGSFTGVRIGLATARGLALAIGRPLAGYSTLDVLTASVEAGVEPRVVVAALDTKRDGYYVAVDGGVPFTGSAAEILARLPRSNILLVGDRVELLKAEMAAEGSGVVVEASTRLPDAGDLARLALLDGVDAWAERNRQDGLPRPLYLRGADVTVGGRRVQA